MKRTVKNSVYTAGVLLILCGLLLFGKIQGGFVSWFLFYSFLVITVYIVSAYIYPIRTWEVKRSIPKQSYVAGDHIEVEIQLKRTIPFPLFYMFCEEQLPISLQKEDRSNEKFNFLHDPDQVVENKSFIAQLPILFKRKITLRYRILHVPRGVHKLQTITLQTSDLFGCIKKETKVKLLEELSVHARTRPIEYYDSNRTFKQETGERSSVMRGLQSAFPASVREYAAGDRMAWIDWKQTAKKNEMMTKEFERERDTSILFILDHHLHDDVNMLAFEGAVETTVALIRNSLSSATTTHLLSVGAEVSYMTIDQEEVETGKIARHMMQIVPEKGPSFARQMEEYSFNLARKALTCVITAHITEGSIDVLQKIQANAGSTMLICVMSADDQTAKVQSIFEQLQARGIQVCVLSEAELTKDPIEVIAYGTL